MACVVTLRVESASSFIPFLAITPVPQKFFTESALGAGSVYDHPEYVEQQSICRNCSRNEKRTASSRNTQTPGSERIVLASATAERHLARATCNGKAAPSLGKNTLETALENSPLSRSVMTPSTKDKRRS